MNAFRDPTRRFSDRVADYVRYRPRYPPALLEPLRRQAGLGPDSFVADLGSGTGIFSELLLRTGCTVFGVEPNAPMRAAAERLLGGNEGFISVDGTAEETGLPDGSVDLVTAAQAFHWFRPGPARAEVARILRPGGMAALVWNSRLTDASLFLREYEDLLQRFGTDYRQVDHLNITPAQLAAFFGRTPERFAFPNDQALDFEGLRGRLLSSSYTPPEGDARREPMLRALREIFERHQERGVVKIVYETEMYLGRMGEGGR